MTFDENRNYICNTMFLTPTTIDRVRERKKGKDYGLHDDDIDDSNTLIIFGMKRKKKENLIESRLYHAVCMTKSF